MLLCLSVRVRPMVIMYRGGEIGKHVNYFYASVECSMNFNFMGLGQGGLCTDLQNLVVRFNSAWTLESVSVKSSLQKVPIKRFNYSG